MSNILIIDDEKAIRKTLTEILSFEGYTIVEAADGEEGLKQFKEKTYDVVLCDIKMPKLDGMEFLQKATEHNPDVPIIMISGHGNIETAVEAVKKRRLWLYSKATRSEPLADHDPECQGTQQLGIRNKDFKTPGEQSAGNDW